jgi:hypothetical protein
MNMSSVKRIDFIFKASIAAYCLSLTLPVFYTEEVTLIELERSADRGLTWHGIFVLLLGWAAALGSPTRYQYWSIAWFANPLFFLAVARLRKKRASSFPISLIGLIVALTSFFLKKIWSDKEPPSTFITEYGVGFYLWLIAFALMVLAAWKSRNVWQE